MLSNIPPGQHILRVARAGERDDERVIEIREGASEQVIQAHLRSRTDAGSNPSPSQGSSSSGIHSSVMPGIVACTNCRSRFAEGVKFCGRCGNRSFTLVSPGESPDSFPCPRCSNPLPQHSRFCGRCGLSIGPTAPLNVGQPVGFATNPSTFPPRAERICRRCNGAYPPHIKFCGRCGYSLV